MPLNDADTKRFRKFLVKDDHIFRSFWEVWAEIPRRYVVNFYWQGNWSSFPNNPFDGEYASTPRACRSQIKKINIANHFVNCVYFFDQIIKKIPKKMIKRGGMELVEFYSTVIFVFLGNALMTGKSRFENHGKIAEDMILEAKIYGDEERNKELSKLPFFTNKKAYQPMLKKFLRGGVVFNRSGNNLGIVLVTHFAIQKARLWEMRGMPELQKKYVKKIKESEGYNITEIAE